MKDWIDEGSTPVYSLRYGRDAQSGTSFRPSDQWWIWCAEWVSSLHPFHCGARRARPMGPGRLFLTLMTACDHEAKSALRCETVHIPETGITVHPIPKIDTGGERRDLNPQW